MHCSTNYTLSTYDSYLLLARHVRYLVSLLFSLFWAPVHSCTIKPFLPFFVILTSLTWERIPGSILLFCTPSDRKLGEAWHFRVVGPGILELFGLAGYSCVRYLVLDLMLHRQYNISGTLHSWTQTRNKLIGWNYSRDISYSMSIASSSSENDLCWGCYDLRPRLDLSLRPGNKALPCYSVLRATESWVEPGNKVSLLHFTVVCPGWLLMCEVSCSRH